MDDQALIAFWHAHFDRPEHSARERSKRWLNLDMQTRGDLTQAFDATAPAITEPEPCADPISTLAEVIRLDHVRRNLLAKTPEAYSGHHVTPILAGAALDAGTDEALQPIERLVLCFSFSLGEDLDTHDRGLDYLRKRQHLEQAQDFLEWAEKRREIIRQFGRFPVRNRPLGRASTPTEAYFVVGTGSDYS